MSAPMQAGGFANLLDPALKHSFFETLDARRKLSKRGEVFGNDTSVRNQEITQGLGNMSSNFGNLATHGQTEYDAFDAGYAKTWKFEEFTKGISVQRSFIDDLLDNNAP